MFIDFPSLALSKIQIVSLESFKCCAQTANLVVTDVTDACISSSISRLPPAR